MSHFQQKQYCYCYCLILVAIILNAGADVVDWLNSHVEGFLDRRDARKYASQMLKAGYIRHTVNKITFSEQCYYIFGDVLSHGKYCSYELLIYLPKNFGAFII